MSKAVLKWLAALGSGAASAALAWVTGHTGSGPSVDPLVAALVVGAVTKLVHWLTSKVPVAA